MTLDKSEIYNILSLDCWNKVYFSRRLYPHRSYGSANGSYWNKLQWGRFTDDELERLEEILRELSARPI